MLTQAYQTRASEFPAQDLNENITFTEVSEASDDSFITDLWNIWAWLVTRKKELENENLSLYIQESFTNTDKTAEYEIKNDISFTEMSVCVILPIISKLLTKKHPILSYLSMIIIRL